MKLISILWALVLVYLAYLVKLAYESMGCFDGFTEDIKVVTYGDTHKTKTTDVLVGLKPTTKDIMQVHINFERPVPVGHQTIYWDALAGQMRVKRS